MNKRRRKKKGKEKKEFKERVSGGGKKMVLPGIKPRTFHLDLFVLINTFITRKMVPIMGRAS